MIGTKFYKDDFNIEDYKECARWCNDSQDGKIVDKGDYYECIPLEKYQPTETDIKTMLTEIVQGYLDGAVQSRGYDNVHTCVSYCNSTDPIFRAEGMAALEWRDKVWRKCYDLLDEVESGQRKIPTVYELLNMLPKLEW